MVPVRSSRFGDEAICELLKRSDRTLSDVRCSVHVVVAALIQTVPVYWQSFRDQLVPHSNDYLAMPQLRHRFAGGHHSFWECDIGTGAWTPKVGLVGTETVLVSHGISDLPLPIIFAWHPVEKRNISKLGKSLPKSIHCSSCSYAIMLYRTWTQAISTVIHDSVNHYLTISIKINCNKEKKSEIDFDTLYRLS